MSMTMGNEHVRLRELQIADWPDINAYSQLPEVCQYQPRGPNTPEETRAFVETTVAAAASPPRRQYAFAATLPESKRVIGLGTLVVQSERFRAGAIGYFLHSDYWMRGLGTEIGRLLLAFGFEQLGLHRICGTCDPRNVGSGRVM